MAGEVVGERAGDVDARRMEVGSGRVSGVSCRAERDSRAQRPPVSTASHNNVPSAGPVRPVTTTVSNRAMVGQRGPCRGESSDASARRNCTKVFGAVAGGVMVFGTPNSGSGAINSNIAGMVVTPLCRRRDPARSPVGPSPGR